MTELKLVCGGTEALLTNNFQGIYRVDFTPKTPSVAGADVSEPAEVLVTNFDQGVTLQRTLNRFFDKARNYTKKKVGDPVYVQYRIADSGPWWVSEVRDGRCELPRRALGAHLRADLFAFQVNWTREGFWDSSAETTVQITNGNGTNQTSLVVDNNTNHYVNIAAAQILGDLPTPAKIRITNNDATPLGVLRIGHGYIPATNQSWIIQGEAAGGGTASGTSSGGQYKALNVTTSETSLLSLTLSSALLDNARRGFFRLMARFSGNPTSAVRLKAKVLYSTNVLSPGKWVRTAANQEWLDLGDVQLPPYDAGGNSAALTLELVGKADTNTTINLDYIACMPVDGWRRFVPMEVGLLGGNDLVDDGPAGRVYELVGTDQVATYGSYGAPIMLQPNTAQKIMFLQAGSNGGAAIDREMTVILSYYQRVVLI